MKKEVSGHRRRRADGDDDDPGLRTSDGVGFYAAGATMASTATTKGKDLVVQFSVKHEKSVPSFCGGGYIKLMAAGTDLATFGGGTPYSIMFGPDICGYDASRVQVILNFQGENLPKTEDVALSHADKDEYTHLYTLVLNADKTYAVYVDQVERASGSLLDDWPFPPKEIDDPDDRKPESWVDAKVVPDATSVKPEGYDDAPATVADPAAVKPEDWERCSPDCRASNARTART